jgi:hypothetical protein
MNVEIRQASLVRESENMVRDTATRLERAAGELEDLLVRVHRPFFYDSADGQDIGIYQKSAKRNAELEQDPDLRDAETVLAAVNSA